MPFSTVFDSKVFSRIFAFRLKSFWKRKVVRKFWSKLTHNIKSTVIFFSAQLFYLGESLATVKQLNRLRIQLEQLLLNFVFGSILFLWEKILILNNFILKWWKFVPYWKNTEQNFNDKLKGFSAQFPSFSNLTFHPFSQQIECFRRTRFFLFLVILQPAARVFVCEMMTKRQLI